MQTTGAAPTDSPPPPAAVREVEHAPRIDLACAYRMIAYLGDRNAMILRNHGTLAVGEQIADAFLRIYTLEKTCEVQALLMAVPAERLGPAPQGAATKVAGQVSSGMEDLSRHLLWPAIQRKMDRLDAGYRV